MSLTFKDKKQKDKIDILIFKYFYKRQKDKMEDHKLETELECGSL